MEDKNPLRNEKFERKIVTQRKSLQLRMWLPTTKIFSNNKET